MKQSTDTILMIEPVAFGFNPQTAEDNYFQVNDGSNPDSRAEKTQLDAWCQFNDFVRKLRSKGINVITVRDTLNPHTPSSIFPNDWVSFHENGTVYLYAMYAENRRLERRLDIIELLMKDFHVSNVRDYSFYEAERKFIEGIGSMILDYVNKIAYGSISNRLDEEVFRKWCTEFGYRPIVFHSFQNVNGERLPIYHITVLMCVGTDYAVICLDSIDSEQEKALVVKTLKDTNKHIIEITEEQVNNFAGNMLEVRNVHGQRFLVMSESAYKALTPNQIDTINAHVDGIIYSDLSVIEKNEGGSARCMIGEIFLPKAHEAKPEICVQTPVEPSISGICVS